MEKKEEKKLQNLNKRAMGIPIILALIFMLFSSLTAAAKCTKNGREYDEGSVTSMGTCINSQWITKAKAKAQKKKRVTSTDKGK